ncbi:MAG: cell division protein ZapE [Francisellaceae bacterium]|jgi:cell division protein ZapE
MLLLTAYRDYIHQHNYEEDTIQEEAIAILQRIINDFDRQPKRKTRWLSFSKKLTSDPIKGTYFWGGVGRGKTFIMDLFYDNIKIEEKTRIHFNHFMKEVHGSLHKYSGTKNSLHLVADDWATKCRLICFDEFFVEDIADAMILGGLFTMLFERGVCLVATSNVKPNLLYAGGLQRESFLPAIKALIANVEVFNLDAGVDYRWREIIQSERYFYPLKTANTMLDKLFKLATNNDFLMNQTLLLEGRHVNAYATSEYHVWFDFNEICGYGRGVSDYIDIASKYKTVFISNLHLLDSRYEEEARRFIALIDELYDKRIITVISAEIPMQEIYCGDRLKFEIQRTISRIKEMQSEEYNA